MKINSSLIHKAYSNTVLDAKKQEQKTNGLHPFLSPKTDKIEVSQEALQAKVISKASKALVDELNEDYGAQRLAQLKDSIRSNQYHVDSQSLAEAMIQRAKHLGGLHE